MQKGLVPHAADAVDSTTIGGINSNEHLAGCCSTKMMGTGDQSKTLCPSRSAPVSFNFSFLTNSLSGWVYANYSNDDSASFDEKIHALNPCITSLKVFDPITKLHWHNTAPMQRLMGVVTCDTPAVVVARTLSALFAPLNRPKLLVAPQ
jgi:hypothetical protein